jgi:hypothetical protein
MASAMALRKENMRRATESAEGKRKALEGDFVRMFKK